MDKTNLLIHTNYYYIHTMKYLFNLNNWEAEEKMVFTKLVV
jgi:hypothetical protein